MTFDRINRRTHLYGALVLMPWFLMYGVSSIPFSHPGGQAQWAVRSERGYNLPPIQPGADLDEIGARMVRDVGINGRFGAYLNPAGNLQVYCSRFTGPSRVTYLPGNHRLLVEDQRFHLPSFLTGMHARAGIERGGFLDVVWAVLVDVFSRALVVWVASGIYMWWRLKQLRFWGTFALGGGLTSFLVFLLAL